MLDNSLIFATVMQRYSVSRKKTKPTTFSVASLHTN